MSANTENNEIIRLEKLAHSIGRAVDDKRFDEVPALVSADRVAMLTYLIRHDGETGESIKGRNFRSDVFLAGMFTGAVRRQREREAWSTRTEWVPPTARPSAPATSSPASRPEPSRPASRRDDARDAELAARDRMNDDGARAWMPRRPKAPEAPRTTEAESPDSPRRDTEAEARKRMNDDTANAWRRNKKDN